MSLPESTSPRITNKIAAELRARAESLGLVVTTRCAYCGSPLWDSHSVSAGAGPICRRRHENDPGAHPAKNARTEAATPTTSTTREDSQ